VQVVTLAVLGLSGSGWVDTAAIVTSVRNFPRHRGSVVGKLLMSGVRGEAICISLMISRLCTMTMCSG
jgi:Nodulin-like